MRTLKILVLLVAVAFAFAACGNQSSETTESTSNGGASGQTMEVPEGSVAGTVVETMDSGGYTYVRLNTDAGEIWAAGPETVVATGQRLVVSQQMAMRDFRSETLDRTFDVVYFVGSFGGAESAPAAQNSGMPAGHPEIMPDMPEGHPEVTPGADIDTSGLEAAEFTIERILTEKADLGGKKVQVRGKVVKANSGIMGRNWLHIQDGTGADGSNDLTVTTSGTAEVGDTVVIEGVIALDKDFGAGYRYDVIVEGATVTVE